MPWNIQVLLVRQGKYKLWVSALTLMMMAIYLQETIPIVEPKFWTIYYTVNDLSSLLCNTTLLSQYSTDQQIQHHWESTGRSLTPSPLHDIYNTMYNITKQIIIYSVCQCQTLVVISSKTAASCLTLDRRLLSQSKSIFSLFSTSRASECVAA